MLHEPSSFLEHYFLFSSAPPNAITGQYVIPLVILSYIVASVGAYTGLKLATGIHKVKTEEQKNILHIGGSVAFGTAIWSMHFIGMLAYKMTMVHTYNAFLTIISMLIAIIIAYFVLKVIRAGTFKLTRILFSAVLLGLAICSMHYSGMQAMEMQANLFYIPSLFILSVIIAISASGAALCIVFTLGQHDGKHKLLWKIVAALIMGAAICGMHYTGMAAAVFIPYADCRFDPNQDFTTLALAVSFVTFAVLGLTVLLNNIAEGNEQESQSALDGKYNAFRPTIMVFVIGIMITTFACYFIHDEQKHKAERTFVNLAQNYSLKMASALEINTHFLDAVGLLFAASQYVDENEFSKYVTPILHRTDYIEAVFYAPLIEATDIQEHEAEISENLPDYKVIITESSKQPPGIHAPILYSVASEHFNKMTGYDVASFSPAYSKAILASKNNNKVTASKYFPPYFHELNKQKPEKHLVIFQYTQSALVDGAARQQGIIISVIDLTLFTERFLEGEDAGDLIVSLGHEVRGMDYLDAQQQGHQEIIKIKDHPILLNFTPKEGAFNRSREPEYLMFLAGLFSTIVLAGYVYTFSRQRLKDISLQSRLNESVAEQERLNTELTERTLKLQEAHAENMRVNKSSDIANRAKNNLLTNMIDEIKTPIQSVISTAGLLVQTKLDEQQKAYANTIKTSGHSLLEIIEDISGISKIEAGTPRLERVNFDLIQVLQEMTNLYTFQAEKKGIKLAFDVEQKLPTLFAGDPARIKQIFANLLSNALKSTDEGHILIHASVNKQPRTGYQDLTFTVEDTGKGIAEDKLAQIFDSAPPAETSTTNTQQQTGLGLEIVKQLVELMEGTVSVKSKQSQSTTFTFNLVLKESEKINRL